MFIVTIKALTTNALGRLGKCSGSFEYAIKTKISYVSPINNIFHSVAMKLADYDMREFLAG